MAEDYYALLGIRRDASQTEIKSAYRRLARELHPDVNPDPETQEKFKEINHAYDVLSDAQKRKVYDEFGEEGLREGFDADRVCAYRDWASRQRRGGGAGGGSVAYVDAAGGLRVGPRSAGASPGPACYGRGGI